MKHVALFENFRPDSEFYTYEKAVVKGTPTWKLKVYQEAWERIKHLYAATAGVGHERRDLIPQYYDSEKRLWKLEARTYYPYDGTCYNIYGVHNSDYKEWTFGDAPNFYYSDAMVSAWVAKEIFDKFIREHLSNMNAWVTSHRGMLKGKKFNI